MAVFHHAGLMKVLKSQQAGNEKENIMTLLSIFELKVGLIECVLVLPCRKVICIRCTNKASKGLSDTR